MSPNDRNHPLYRLFYNMVCDAVAAEMPGRDTDDVEHYVAGLLFEFLDTETVYAVRDAQGRRLTSVYEMLGEADVLINAESFERERQVHKHIGDYILFWTGVNPDYLNRIKLDDGRDLVCDYTRQGKESYHVVSTFDYSPFDAEAPTFRRLSEDFEGFVYALGHLRPYLPFHAA